MKKIVGTLLASTALLFLFPTATFATNLTDVTLFSTSGGNFNGALYWNTRGGDVSFNVYFQDSTAPGVFLNTGDLTPLSVALVPGSITLNLFAQPGGGLTTAGLNLFFNGSNAPGISASTTVGSSSFAALGGTTVAPNAPATVPGANTLTFTDGTNTVVLTALLINPPGGTDAVQPYNNVPGGGADYLGSFTLRVTSSTTGVPEPATTALLGLGLVALAWRRKATR
jgi:hypothetical protein